MSFFSLTTLTWFIPFCALCYGLFLIYVKFDPIDQRNSCPSNVSHAMLPAQRKPAHNVSSEDIMYFYCSATELGRFLREKRITSVELVQKFIDQLLIVNPSINAVGNYRFSQALDEAMICDDIINRLTTIYDHLIRRENFQRDSLSNDSDDDFERTEVPKYEEDFDDIPLEFSLEPYDISDYPQLASLSQLTKTSSPTLLSAPKKVLALTKPDEKLASFLSRYLPPFFGIPCTTKECFALKGFPHTSGLVSRRAQIADYTSPIILNMQRAGFCIIGTSNTSELCMWMESQNLVYGQTRNPYSLKRTPGGSSGGEGALLASLSTTVSLGSDVGGSIRMPAFFNGIYGHKPTSQYASCIGQVPSSRGGIPEYYCQAGPMARYPADLWPMLQVMVQSPIVSDTAPTTTIGLRVTDDNKSILNLPPEVGIDGKDVRQIQLLPRPNVACADLKTLQNDYNTTREGETIIDLSRKLYHNPHGISAKYDNNQDGNSPYAQSSFNWRPIDKNAPNAKIYDSSVSPPNASPTISPVFKPKSLGCAMKLSKFSLNGSSPALSSSSASDTGPLTNSPSVNSEDGDFETEFHQNASIVTQTQEQNDIISDKSITQQVHHQPGVYQTAEFLPYPHYAAKYYDFSSLKTYSFDQYPILTSTHPSQVYYPYKGEFPPEATENPENLIKINEVSPYSIDISKVPVYTLKSFGSTTVPLSTVQQVIKDKQRDAAQYFADIGCDVYEIDLDAMFVFLSYQHLVQQAVARGGDAVNQIGKTMVPVTDTGIVQLNKGKFVGVESVKITTHAINEDGMGSLAETPTAQKKEELKEKKYISPIDEPKFEVFRQFRFSFDFWSAGMTLTYSAFRELLLQDCTEKSMKESEDMKIDQKVNKNETVDQFTSYEYLSRYTNYTNIPKEVIASLPFYLVIIYNIFLYIATFFHTIRKLCISLFLPLEGIPFFSEFEGHVEIKRQKQLFSQIQSDDHKPLDLTSIEPMPLNHIKNPLQMGILSRIYFEWRIASYIIYHLILSICCPPMVPVGVPCLSCNIVTNRDEECPQCYYTKKQELPKTKMQQSLFKPPQYKDSIIINKRANFTPNGVTLEHLDRYHDYLLQIQSEKAHTRPTFNKSSPQSKDFENDAESEHDNSSDSKSDMTDDEFDGIVINSRSSLRNDQQILEFSVNPRSTDVSSETTFKYNTLQFGNVKVLNGLHKTYLALKQKYPYCNCTHVLQTPQQIQLLNATHNITIFSLFQSFLPQTPYTFPALLLALIDRIGELVPGHTLSTLKKSFEFAEELNRLLAPSPSQPYGAILLAPPHPRVAPGHFSPCTKPFNFVYTGVFNATMTPVTSVPLGLVNNLPTGTQIVGARHCDVTTICAALHLHKQFGGWQPAKRLSSKY